MWTILNRIQTTVQIDDNLFTWFGSVVQSPSISYYQKTPWYIKRIILCSLASSRRLWVQKSARWRLFCFKLYLFLVAKSSFTAHYSTAFSTNSRGEIIVLSLEIVWFYECVIVCCDDFLRFKSPKYGSVNLWLYEFMIVWYWERSMIEVALKHIHIYTYSIVCACRKSWQSFGLATPGSPLTRGKAKSLFNNSFPRSLW